MNHSAIKAELEKRAKILIAKRDGKQNGHEEIVDEDDEHITHDDHVPSDRNALKAELARRAAEFKRRRSE